MADSFTDVHYTSADGLKLHARVYGEAITDTVPVVCLPGLTRNARDFHELALHLSKRADKRRKVIAFDYRGRGGSAYDPNWRNYSVPVEAADIADGLTVLGVDKAYFIGTSRGGLILHVLVTMRPALIGAVVFNDIGPVVEGEGLALIRTYLANTPRPRNIAEAVDVQRAIHGQAFTALSDADWTRMASAIYRDLRGMPVPDYDPQLPNVLRDFRPEQPLPQLWQQFEGFSGVPMLVFRGQNSKLLSPATLDEMTKRHPDCETFTVEAQGHAPLLDTGDIPDRIVAFFARADSKAWEYRPER